MGLQSLFLISWCFFVVFFPHQTRSYLLVLYKKYFIFLFLPSSFFFFFFLFVSQSFRVSITKIRGLVGVLLLRFVRFFRLAVCLFLVIFVA